MNTLADKIAAQLDAVPPPALEPVCEAIHSRFGDAVVGVLFYGSCIHQGDQLEGVVDLYVIVFPATIGETPVFGVWEVAAIALIFGSFGLLVFRAFAAAPAVAQHDPYLEESLHYHAG